MIDGDAGENPSQGRLRGYLIARYLLGQKSTL